MPQDSPSLTELTSRWSIAQERARRANRNLLQYGAGLVTVITAFGSIAGILGIADAVKNPQKDSTILFATSGGAFTIQSLIVALAFIAAFFFVVLLMGIWFSLVKRGIYEGDEEKYLRQIISLQPERFLPKASSE